MGVVGGESRPHPVIRACLLGLVVLILAAACGSGSQAKPSSAKPSELPYPCLLTQSEVDEIIGSKGQAFPPSASGTTSNQTHCTYAYQHTDDNVSVWVFDADKFRTSLDSVTQPVEGLVQGAGAYLHGPLVRAVSRKGNVILQVEILRRTPPAKMEEAVRLLRTVYKNHQGNSYVCATTC